MLTSEEKEEIKEIIKECTEKKLTKKEIMAIQDRSKRKKLIAENMDLFVSKEQE